MKFGKHLRESIEAIQPEWAETFLCYKSLKRQITACLEEEEPSGGASASASAPASHEKKGNMRANCFTHALTAEVNRLSDFFIDKEEDFLMIEFDLRRQSEVIATRDGAAGGNGDIRALMQEVVQFHAEVVLLENYCTLNLVALNKILKKYDKRSGSNLRSEAMAYFAENCPFWQHGLPNIARNAETLFNALCEKLSREDGASPGEEPVEGATEIGKVEGAQNGNGVADQSLGDIGGRQRPSQLMEIPRLPEAPELEEEEDDDDDKVVSNSHSQSSNGLASSGGLDLFKRFDNAIASWRVRFLALRHV